jgi:DNA-directed RNA polymerase
MLVQLDHTSSGVQIAAALAKHSTTAAAVNIAGGESKSDLYTNVASAANASLQLLGSPIVLKRADVKKAVIAKVYGGTHKTIYQAFAEATGLSHSAETAPLFATLKDAIDDQMSGVVTVQKWFKQIVEALHASGASEITITLPHGGKLTVPFAYGEAVLPMFVAKVDGETLHAVNVSYSTGVVNVSGTAKSLVAQYIQSFDATLLAMTQIGLDDAGIWFLTKHDAYLVEKEDEAAVLPIVQQAFFGLFSINHLDNLHAEILATYGVDVGRFNAYGDYDVAQVLKSKFIIA